MSMRPVVVSPVLDTQELDDLWRDVLTEILDPEYTRWTHGNYRTYIKGCHGPICNRGRRNYMRTRQEEISGTTIKRNKRLSAIDSVTAEFEEYARRVITTAQEELIERLA